MSVFTQLYRGETRFDFIGTRRRWYLASLVLLSICVLSMVFRGFNVGIDFKGGTQFQVQAANTSITPKQVEEAMAATGHPSESAAQQVGSGATRQIIIKTKELKLDEQSDVQRKLAAALKVDPNKGISVDSVSSSWGGEITKKAIQGLLVFLLVVFAYITLRFEVKMAVGAMVALLHDLVVAAGIYSIVGFELTPSTIVGLLTILGFSLYDTVVVFDKVAENTKDLLATGRETYASAANRAVNQTLMRSINTSLISLLPVAGLLFVGAGILGVGTIKDLALILFIGLAVGAYSSLFLATPVVVDLKEREPQYKGLAKRVQARRSSARVTAEPAVVGAPAPVVRRGTPAPAPKPGARPASRPARKRP
ncbi:protein translocase subunit SecF [Jatrophihabitans sp.]|jgi:preprotein translocase subunit SecF|uniref:protein translocase subunit SecF n=1 Tax=Jatrophihabitans sp. TaxID=1932789 RepID=UPI002EF2B839